MWAVASALHAILVPLDARPSAEVWLGAASIWAMFLVVVLITALIWSRLPLSLGRLRALELFLFGLPLINVIWWYVDQLGLKHLLLRTFQEGGFFVPFILSTIALYFLVTIVTYGTLIPNTGRRCGLVVTMMAVVPVALAAAVGFFEVEIRTRFLAPFLIYLTILVMWMGVAVALAVYGSHRVEILRREVQAARQMGQYRLKQRLGAGGMGEVYLAEHVLLRRPCASS